MRCRPTTASSANGSLESAGRTLADRFIAELEDHARVAADLLRDSSACVVHWVTVPEALAIEETIDAERALRASGISVSEIVLNRVTPPGPPCPLCDRRRRSESAALAAVHDRWRRRTVRVVDALLREPRGLARLRPIGERLLGPPAGSWHRSIAQVGGRGPIPTSSAPLKMARLAGTRLLFCGGKGGVGKTTVAAALALRLARARPRDSILLLSTDPAHSLGDVLAMTVSDAPSPLRKAANLSVRELDARAALAARRAPIEASFQTLAEKIGSAGLGTIAGGSLHDLIDLAPPGIDELLGMLSILDARHAYDTIVVDMAPTGHALRLLETPAAAREWVQALIRLLAQVSRARAPRVNSPVISSRCLARFERCRRFWSTTPPPVSSPSPGLRICRSSRPGDCWPHSAASASRRRSSS